MDFKIDYLRFTIKPKFEIHSILSFTDFLINDILGMPDKLLAFKYINCGGFYDQKIYFNNIYIKTPPVDNFKQGFQIEMTGEGYDYFIEYRMNNEPLFTERQFIANLFSLREFDTYEFNVTRCDFAFDDKSFNETYFLDFDTIKNAVLSGSVVTRFRQRRVIENGEIVNSDNSIDNVTPFAVYESGSASVKFKGSTIYLGSRSRTHVRFYDKIAEMKFHGKEYDENIKHWMRFELQACRDNAMALLTKFIELEPEEFSKYIASVLLDMVRFVDTSKEALQSNYYRCPVVKWWSDFIGTLDKSKLVHKKPKVNRFKKAVEWTIHSVAATAGAIIKSVGVQGFLGYIKQGIDEHYKLDTHDLIVDDYINKGNFDIEQLHGVDVFSLYFSNEKKYRSFLVEMRKLREETFLKIMEQEKWHQEALGNSFTDCS